MSRNSGTRRLARIAVAALAGASFLAVAPAAHAAGRCLGRPATLIGTNGPDVLVGTGGADGVLARDGDDVVRGRAGNDRLCSGPGADIVIGGSGNDQALGAGDNDTVRGGGGNDELNGGRGRDTLLGGQGDDMLVGGPDDDRLEGGNGIEDLLGGLGNDVLESGPGEFAFMIGGPGNDTLTSQSQFGADACYCDAPGPVNVDLAAGTATGHGTDTLNGITGIIGSPFDDTLAGDDGDNFIAGLEGNDTITLRGDPGTVQKPFEADLAEGGPGNDSIDGGSGFDVSFYFEAPGPVNANLTTGTATGDGTDTLTSIEGVAGGAFNDTLIGNGADNLLEGNGGNDTLDGEGGTGDAVVFFSAETPVTVNLSTGASSSADMGTDTLADIEGVFGSFTDDSITGSPVANRLVGGPGSDTIQGLDGDDFLDGDDIGDPFGPFPGTDTLDGGNGVDTCINGESLANCESTVPPPAPSAMSASRWGAFRFLHR